MIKKQYYYITHDFYNYSHDFSCNRLKDTLEPDKNELILQIIKDKKKEGFSRQMIANYLNSKGFKTLFNLNWTESSVKYFLNRSRK